MKILQLSTHATLHPRHGGPLRSHHIARHLEEAGFEVSRIAVCWRDENVYDPRETIIDLRRSGFWSSAAYEAVRTWEPCLPDYYGTVAVAQSPELKHDLLSGITAADPDIILLQHPWNWPLVKNLPGIDTGDTRVVYSSHNVESLLKRKMVEDAGITVPADILHDVEALERDLVKFAKATIVCTEADAEVFRTWGASQVVVASNGTTFKYRDHLLCALPPPLKPEHRFALFIGSRYLPNVTGFFKYLAPALSSLRPNHRIVVAGTVSEAIDTQLATSTVRHYQEHRLLSLGYVDDTTLDVLIANASALLLPIDYGGGSHLKTAEALASGRPIIGTSTSFRGFTKYQDLERVTIADSCHEFIEAVHKALASGAEPCNLAIPRDVIWERTLEPAVQLMRKLADDARLGKVRTVHSARQRKDPCCV